MIQLTACAKINLALHLIRPRPDGYTELATVMQSIALADTLTVTWQDQAEGFVLTVDDPVLQQSVDQNLLTRVYERFNEQCPISQQTGARVFLEKKIPMEAGLGGGSADAAVFLKALNKQCHEPYSLPVLTTLAGQLGSDLPFFLSGGTALGLGRGEEIQPVVPGLTPGLSLVLVKPKQLGVSTALAYQAVRQRKQYSQQNSPEKMKSLVNALQRPGITVREIQPLLFNDFEPVIFELLPALGAMYRQLNTVEGLSFRLTGSGAALFSFYDPHQHRETDLRPALETVLMAVSQPYEIWFTQTVSS